MTWNELREAIEKIPAEERDNEAVYVEPYDDDAEVYPVDLHEAARTFRVAGVIFAKGDPFLQ